MKKIIIFVCISAFSVSMFAETAKTIALNQPDLSKGLTVMKALSVRASATHFDAKDLSLQDLSDLLWAANGVNRPESGKRTAPSAVNAQDIDVYVVMKTGTYFYDAKRQSLNLVTEGDLRKLAAGRQENFAGAALFCLLVADISRYTAIKDDSMKLTLAAEDAGMVSQNISVFCASAGLSTRPRATMDVEQLKKALGLKDSQYLMLNHPVSYPKK